MVDTIASLRAELVDLKEQLHIVRQHLGHDLAEVKAQHYCMLNETIAPLLSDAIDALEIDPPARSVAIRRIKSVLTAINRR
jgi:hypothetical protein